MAQVNYIKDLYENEDLSLREISRKTGHSFKTIQKYAYQLDWSEDNLPDTEPKSYPVLGDFIPVIDEWLEADRKIPRKQRHTVWRIFCRLRDEQHFTGSYSSVKKYVRKKRFVMNSRNNGYLPLEHALGSGQVDFGKHLYRKNSVWLMNDETALALRTLKDSSGNYLWRDSDDTILGKRVVMNSAMPSVAAGAKPIAFGDFSYYWVIARGPVSVVPIMEHFTLNQQIGYLAFEFLDGKLIRPETIKVLQIAE